MRYFVCLDIELTRCFLFHLQTEKEIATLEGDIKELKDAIDAKNAPMMVRINAQSSVFLSQVPVN